MDDRFESFDNLELTARKSSVIQERINLVSTHMYKQFLDYQNSTMNTQEMFAKIAENVRDTVDYLKQSFASRGISTQNIYYEVDNSKSVIVLTILWHTISFTDKFNIKPQAIELEKEGYLITGRIIAMNGNYYDIVKKSKESELQAVLDSEVMSLYIPSEKVQPSIIKIRHLGNRELFINQVDASKEFVLKVIETICGGGVCHEQASKHGLIF